MSTHDNNLFTIKSTMHYQSVTPLQIIDQGKEDPWAIMQHLDKELWPNTNTTYMSLLHNFISIHCKPDKEIKVFFTHIKPTQGELEESGMVASQAYQLLAILDGLLPKYNAIHAIIKLEDRIDMEHAKQLIHQQDRVFTPHSQVTAVNAASLSHTVQATQQRLGSDWPQEDSNGEASSRQGCKD
jgi:hypothetical protein